MEINISNNQKQPLEVFYKKDVLENYTKFTGKYLCGVSFSIKSQDLASNFIKKKTLTQVLSC